MRKNRRKAKARLRAAPRQGVLPATLAGEAAADEAATGEVAGSLAARAVWILGAKTVAFVLSFALPLLLVRRLDQHEFGLYKQVFLVVGTALTMLPLGFGMSAYYFLPRERQRQGQIVLNIVLFYLLTAGLAALVLALFPQLLAALFQSDELTALAPAIGVAIFFWVLSSFLEIVAVAHQEARLATLFIIVAQFTKGLLLLLAAVWLATVAALVYAAILQGVVQTLLLFFYLRSRFPQFWRRFDWRVLRRQLSYALPLGVAGVLFTVQMDVHSYFVASHFDAATFAIYAIGCFQLPLVGILSESVCSVMIPRVSQLQKQGESREIIELTARVMRKLAAIYFPLYVFLMIAGREFIVALFTEQYAASWHIFAINLTLLPLGILVLDPLLRAYAEQRYFLLRLRLLLIGLLVVGLWLAIHYLGLLGVISVVVFINVLERLVTATRMARVVGARRSDLRLLGDVKKIALAAVAAGLLGLLVKASLTATSALATLAVTGMVFAASYVTVFLLADIVTQEEWSLIRRQVARVPRLVTSDK